MMSLTIRVCIFLLVAILSCWTVIADQSGSSLVPPGSDNASSDPAAASSSDAGQQETANKKSPKKIDPPVDASAQKADPADLQQAAAQVIKATNAFRREHGLEPVQQQEELQQAAQKFAEFMSREDLYGHHADDRTPAQRAKAAGYDYCMVRENIAYRTDTRDNTADGLSKTFTTGWKESPEHRQNMLGQHVTDTGVAIATQDGLTFYAVQMFGRPRDASINLRIRNEADAPATLKIESDYGVDSFELPPNAIATVTRCLPTTLTLKDSESEVEATDSASFAIITSDEDQLQLKRQQDSE